VLSSVVDTLPQYEGSVLESTFSSTTTVRNWCILIVFTVVVTFCGVMSVSRRSGWNRCFTTVEEQLGKAIILLGKRILKKNLENKIAVSPWDTVLEKAKLTFMMDGGWDQGASGKAYNSSSGRVVSVGGYTRKVCYLVYYSRRYVGQIIQR
jgi:hypothetical protein